MVNHLKEYKQTEGLSVKNKPKRSLKLRKN